MSNGVAGGYHNSNNMSMGNQVLQHHQTQQQHHNMPGMSSPHDSDAAMANAAAQLEQQIRGLSSSSSSSSSDSSDSDCGSDSDDSSDEEDDAGSHHPQHQQQQTQHQMHQLPNLMSALPPMSTAAQYNRNTPSSGYASNNSHTNNNGAFTSDLLQNDLQLSSNSSDEDD